jgi:RNA polymerase sigma factor (sigma-70 family)
MSGSSTQAAAKAAAEPAANPAAGLAAEPGVNPAAEGTAVPGAGPGAGVAAGLAAAFEAERGRLHAVAHRMLGSHADAEDVVQEAWLRLSRQDVPAIRSLAGWLTTVVGRISMDVLRSRRSHPHASYDERSPDLVVTADDGLAPEEDLALAESVELGLLLVLESLGPSERLAFVLHDLFAVPFDEIGRILGKSTPAAKMLASRARRKVRAPRPPADGEGPRLAERPPATRPEQRRAVQAFLAAARDGDFDALLRVLDPDVRLTVDTADGVVVTLGATRVAAGARLSAGAAAHGSAVRVNGSPGVVAWREDATPAALMVFTVTSAGRIAALTVVVSPSRLAAMRLPRCPA